MPTPDYLTTNQSEECPRADHALLLEHCKTPHYPLQGGVQSFEGISPLWPPLPGKAIKLLFSTSPKTLSLHFYLAPVNRGRVSARRKDSVSMTFSASSGHLYSLACGLFLHLQRKSLKFLCLSSHHFLCPLLLL